MRKNLIGNILAIAVFAGLFTLTGCAGMTHRQQNAATGAAVGGVAGAVLTGGSAIMPGMVELGEDIFLKPVRRGLPKYNGALADMVGQPRAATVMGLLEEARLARLRGFKVTQKKSPVSNTFGRIKDFIVGNF